MKSSWKNQRFATKKRHIKIMRLKNYILKHIRFKSFEELARSIGETLKTMVNKALKVFIALGEALKTEGSIPNETVESKY